MKYSIICTHGLNIPQYFIMQKGGSVQYIVYWRPKGIDYNLKYMFSSIQNLLQEYLKVPSTYNYLAFDAPKSFKTIDTFETKEELKEKFMEHLI